MFFIRQGATHKIVVGPVVAVANGYVPVTTLALTTADEAEVILHDNGTVVDISAYTWAAITTADGYYHLTLQSGISGTVGHMTVVVNDDSLCLPVKAEFTVIEEALYDGIFAASAAVIPANVTQWLGTAAATPTTAGVPEVDVTFWLGTAASTPTVAGVPNVNVKTWNDLTTVALPLVPTTAGRTLDVSVGGEAGLDWANIGSPTTAQNLSATNIDVDQIVASVSGAVGSVTGAVGSVTGLTAADVGAIKTQTDKFVFTVANQVDANAIAISGDATAADNLESEYDGTGYGHILQRTTIATLASQTSFTLTAGSADNDAYNGCVIVIQDATTAAQKAVGVILDYTGATKTVTLLTDPAVFTIATTDIVTILADRALKATVDNRTLDVSAGGEAGVDWANVGSPTTTVGLSGTTVKTATDVETDTADIQSRIGTVSDLGGGATLAANLSDIEAQTDDIGVAGAGLTEAGGTGDQLTAVPWNAAWDAEVQSEATDALNAYDPPTNTEMVAAFTEIKGATWATTDTLEAIRDRGDAAWITATGFATHSAADVWAVATRALTDKAGFA